MGLDDHRDLIGKFKKRPLATRKSESGVGNHFNAPPGISSLSDTEDRAGRRPSLWVSHIVECIESSLRVRCSESDRNLSHPKKSPALKKPQ